MAASWVIQVQLLLCSVPCIPESTAFAPWPACSISHSPHPLPGSPTQQMDEFFEAMEAMHLQDMGLHSYDSDDDPFDSDDDDDDGWVRSTRGSRAARAASSSAQQAAPGARCAQRLWCCCRVGARLVLSAGWAKGLPRAQGGCRAFKECTQSVLVLTPGDDRLVSLLPYACASRKSKTWGGDVDWETFVADFDTGSASSSKARQRQASSPFASSGRGAAAGGAAAGSRGSGPGRGARQPATPKVRAGRRFGLNAAAVCHCVQALSLRSCVCWLAA